MPHLSQRKIANFRAAIRSFYRKNERSFPWRETRDPYRILVSEIMLQQTQTERVRSYYRSFLKRFPTVRVLARASLADVLILWRGLGYNRRARALRDAAIKIQREFRGIVPSDEEQLRSLPGIGPYTAAAVGAFAFNKRSALIETNIRTVFLHHFFPIRSAVSDLEILPLVEQTLPQKNVREWYYALMDYGVSLKKQIPKVNHRSRHFRKQSRFKGSRREARGRILSVLSKEKKMTRTALKNATKLPSERIEEALDALIREGFIEANSRSLILTE